MLKYVCFDPGVINDNGTIRIYYGTWSGRTAGQGFPEQGRSDPDRYAALSQEPQRSSGHRGQCDGTLHSYRRRRHDDCHQRAETHYPGRCHRHQLCAHPFFEASSIRKIGEKYYFIYSSWQNHELCYATSDYPDRDFVFGGTIVSNGDVGYQGRAEKRPPEHDRNDPRQHRKTSMVSGTFSITVLTHKSDYSRQACAEPITILPDWQHPPR